MTNDIWVDVPFHLYDVFHAEFTDQPAPESASVTDVSEAKDGGVVRWNDGNAYFFSTQRPGVKVVAPESCSALFATLTELTSVDVSMLDTSYTTNMERVFGDCENLKDIRGLETWDVSKVQNMRWMFSSCHALRNVDALADWNVTEVLNMNQMFDSCCSIKNVDGLAKWDVSHVQDMGGMFMYCRALRNIEALADWNVGNVQNMSYMFSNCYRLKNVDGLKNWNVNHVQNMTGMFWMTANDVDFPSLQNVDGLA
jgi:surface protein